MTKVVLSVHSSNLPIPPACVPALARDAPALVLTATAPAAKAVPAFTLAPTMAVPARVLAPAMVVSYRTQRQGMVWKKTGWVFNLIITVLIWYFELTHFTCALLQTRASFFKLFSCWKITIRSSKSADIFFRNKPRCFGRLHQHLQSDSLQSLMTAKGRSMLGGPIALRIIRGQMYHHHRAQWAKWFHHTHRS